MGAVDPMAEAAKRALQQQASQQQAAEHMMNSIPGVLCTNTIIGHVPVMTPDGPKQLVKIIFMMPTGPFVVLMDPEFVTTQHGPAITQHAIQAQTGIEVVSNGNGGSK